MKERFLEVSNWSVSREIKKINPQEFVQLPQFPKEGNLGPLVFMWADNYVC